MTPQETDTKQQNKQHSHGCHSRKYKCGWYEQILTKDVKFVGNTRLNWFKMPKQIMWYFSEERRKLLRRHNNKRINEDTFEEQMQEYRQELWKNLWYNTNKEQRYLDDKNRKITSAPLN